VLRAAAGPVHLPGRRVVGGNGQQPALIARILADGPRNEDGQSHPPRLANLSGTTRLGGAGDVSWTP